MNILFSAVQKLLMKLELEHQDTYCLAFFNMIYRISSSQICHVEKSTVQVYMSPSLFITVNENMKQASE
jgi:hypothetical protein